MYVSVIGMYVCTGKRNLYSSSSHTYKCLILLSELFIEVKIKIKIIKLFYDEITSDRIENTFQLTLGMISTQLRVCKLCPR